MAIIAIVYETPFGENICGFCGGEWFSRDVWESDLIKYQEEAKETCR